MHGNNVCQDWKINTEEGGKVEERAAAAGPTIRPTKGLLSSQAHFECADIFQLDLELFIGDTFISLAVTLIHKLLGIKSMPCQVMHLGY